MNIIEQTLARVPVTEGFVGLYLVELGTGHVLASIDPSIGTSGKAGDVRGVVPTGGGSTGRLPDDVDPAGPAVLNPTALATTLAEVVQLITSMVTVNALAGDLEDLVITLSGHHHLVRVMPDFAGTDAFLLLCLDRSRANLAMARYLLLTFEAELVA